MAFEEGLVIRAVGEQAWIKTQRSAACENCHSKDSCQTMGSGKDMEVEAVNSIGARTGDQVVISFSTASLLKGTFLIYIFPVICLMIGAGIGVKLSEMFDMERSATSALVGFGALVLSFIFVRARGNRLAESDKYKPRIIRIKKPLSKDSG